MSLHVAVSGWLLGPHSGANRRLLALLAELRELLAVGEHVSVLHGVGFHPPWQHPRMLWLPVRIPSGPPWRRVLAERWRLPRLLAELGAQVLDHGLLPAPRVPCRLCLTIHDLRDADGEGGRRPALARLALRRALARADAVVVPSAFTAGRVQAHGMQPRQLRVIANAATLPSAKPPADAGGYFLHVGHLEARKNLALLVSSFAALPADLRDRQELRLVGADHGAGAELRRLAERLGVGGRVRFVGALSDDHLPTLYAGATAVCVPSRYEGFGLCAAEGIAAGRPVLVSDRGALPEVVGDDGVVLPADDPAAWTAALAAAASHRRRPSPRRRSDGWRRAAQDLLACWRSLAATG